MYRFLLKPRWIAFHLLVVTAMVAMVNLGLWQLRRLHERRVFNELVTTHASMNASGDESALRGTLADWEWRVVTVTGSYTERATIDVVNRELNGDPGRYLVNAFRTSGGQVVVVNRGFVPSRIADEPAPPRGEVQLVGRVRRSETRRLGQNTDDTSQQLSEVRRVDLSVLATQFDGASTTMYLDRLDSTPADPAAVEEIPLPALDEGPHMSYAIQWFIFTVCVGAGWWLAVRRSAHPERRGRRRGGAPPIDEEASAAFEAARRGAANAS